MIGLVAMGFQPLYQTREKNKNKKQNKKSLNRLLVKSASPLLLSIISYPTRAGGIVVNYTLKRLCYFMLFTPSKSSYRAVPFSIDADSVLYSSLVA